MRNLYLLILLLSIGGFQLPVESTPLVSLASGKAEPKFFWYPKENGGFIPAFLEGGPKTKANVADIQFYLYTIGSDTPYELLVGDDANFDNPANPYIPNAPLKIFAHGFGASYTTGPGPSWRRAFVEGGYNYNMIFINWEKLAASPWYDTAAANTNITGVRTAELVNYLVSKGVVTLDQVHCIGHSLGAHVAAFLGVTIGARQIGRITGLDPALPLFGVADDIGRLDPTDAIFVDVIHTAGGTLLEGGLAFTDPRGDIDFYPNSGSHQPGCGVDAFGSCSHGRGNAYAVESINHPTAFTSWKCDDWEHFNNGQCVLLEKAQMGYHVDQSLRGNFYLITNGESPYSTG